jgi:hypothetical protein
MKRSQLSSSVRPQRAITGGKMKVTSWVWAGPVAFVIHDAEEVATVAPWLKLHRSQLPEPVRSLMTITTREFAFAAIVLALGFALAAAHGVVSANQKRLSIPFLLAAGAFVANGLTHVLQAAAFRGYTPGILTAVCVVLPYGVGLNRSLIGSHLATRQACLLALAAGVVLQIPLVLMAIAAGRL